MTLDEIYHEESEKQNEDFDELAYRLEQAQWENDSYLEEEENG